MGMKFDAMRQMVAENLRFYRLQREMLQSELAHKASISTRQYQKIEKAQANPTLDTLTSLAFALEVPLEVLMRLSFVRTSLSEKEFRKSFEKTFANHTMRVGLADREGTLLWVSPPAKKYVSLVGQKVLRSEGGTGLDLYRLTRPYIYRASFGEGAESAVRIYPSCVINGAKWNPLLSCLCFVESLRESPESYASFVSVISSLSVSSFASP